MSPEPNDIDLSLLPPEHRAAFEAMQRRVDVLAEANKRQEALIKELRHALHGRKSEKLTEDERQLAFEDLTIAIEECEAASEEAGATQKASRTKRAPVNRNLGKLPEDLLWIEEIIEPNSLECPCGCGQMHKIGEDRTDRLDIVPPLLGLGRTAWTRTLQAIRRHEGGEGQAICRVSDVSAYGCK